MGFSHECIEQIDAQPVRDGVYNDHLSYFPDSIWKDLGVVDFSAGRTHRLLGRSAGSDPLRHDSVWPAYGSTG